MCNYYSLLEAEEQLNEWELQDEKNNCAEALKIYHVFEARQCELLTGYHGGEIFEMVIDKLLFNDRPWPRGVKFIAYCLKSGRGIISNEYDKNRRNKNRAKKKNIFKIIEKGLYDFTPLEILELSESKKIDDWITLFQKKFKKDKDISCYIKKMLENFEEYEIIKLCDFTNKIYKNVVRRLKYKLKKEFPTGVSLGKILL